MALERLRARKSDYAGCVLILVVVVAGLQGPAGEDGITWIR